MVWVVVAVVASVIVVVLWRDLTRQADPTALPRGTRTPDGHHVSEERGWDGVRQTGINHQGPGPL